MKVTKVAIISADLPHRLAEHPWLLLDVNSRPSQQDGQPGLERTASWLCIQMPSLWTISLPSTTVFQPLIQGEEAPTEKPKKRKKLTKEEERKLSGVVGIKILKRNGSASQGTRSKKRRVSNSKRRDGGSVNPADFITVSKELHTVGGGAYTWWLVLDEVHM